MTLSLPYSQDVSPALTDAIGEHGITQHDLDAALSRISGIASALKARSEKGELAFLAEPSNTVDLPLIQRIADRLRNAFSHVVIMGTGGSSLGGLTLASLAQPRFAKAGTQLHFIDNTDPNTMDQLLSQLPLADTGFVLISKSGNTVETLAQAMLAIEALEAESLPISHHCLAITMPGPRGMRQLAEHYKMEILDHDPELGGRFSVLSCVGLIPAAIAGLPIVDLRAGAQAVMDACWSTTPEATPPAIGAALNFALMQKGKPMSVIMPYCDRLQNLGRWYQQLWGESVGKEGKGTTAIAALGAVDQHSQLQLYAEGPKDKLITFITFDHGKMGRVLPKALAERTGLDYLAGHHIGDVLNAQQAATMQSLTGYGAAIRHIALKDDSAFTLGALLQHYMMETAFMAGLMNVDAFNQPGVEESKNLTRERLQKS